jgi:tetratricopeptide (TPR) repeat protein
MRQLILTLLLAGLLFPSAGRGGIDRGEVPALFREANVRYEGGDYAGAADGYREIVEGGWESAPVYYNLGNAYFKQNRLGPAILHYRKARNLAPRDPETNKNLEYAGEALKDDITVLPLPFWSRAGRTVAGWLSLAEWIGISAVLYFLTGLWLLAVILLRSLRKFSPAVLKTLLPALVLAAALSFFARSYYRTPRAIILAPEVSVRYGPQENEAAAFNLHEGTEVRVVRERNGWVQVALPDGTSGWLPADSLGMI